MTKIVIAVFSIIIVIFGGMHYLCHHCDDSPVVKSNDTAHIEKVFATAKVGDFVIIPSEGRTNVVIVVIGPTEKEPGTGMTEYLQVKAPTPFPKGIRLYGAGDIHGRGTLLASEMPAEMWVADSMGDPMVYKYWAVVFARRSAGIDE